ncbi:MAG: dethiobiotin synthase [Nitrospirae bacterium GWC2_46_6]|nr:MAG: dethiobiotin synthase [Nitrospirae bacterium GWC2_46_6]OGW21371.1 MAG: dethiobiotin synthase [Nitrospirae bacterium GWA2_46_11]OGW26153.1 MAG: dethiobiotin synthase [Nitrospirae bacterium GWB2_47_37]HAK89448.1 dethiobiotin synthase [Nitrospiraceae bacterium]HCZ11690.1 dethiobiotin synthase [Nitrospiraceae bacterium]
MSKGVFITGTDTGVGKTVVSAAIIRAMIKKGVKAGAMKPIETGCIKTRGKGLIPSDGIFLKEMAGMDDPINLITPIRFEHPLAPMVASKIEKRPIEIKKIFDAYKLLSKEYDFMVIEGVGGLLVPIAKRQKAKGRKVYFVADLIKDLKLSVVVVARPTIGTINHTLLTVNYALREGINILGVIINFNNPPENSLAEKTNPEVLKELCPVPIIGMLPYIEDITKNNIENAALKHLEITGLF